MRFRSSAAPQDASAYCRRGKGVRQNMRNTRKALARKIREAERRAEG